MHIIQVLAIVFSLSALAAAGPLRRDGENRSLQRRFQNITSSANSVDGIQIIPMARTSVVSFETEQSTTIAITTVVAITTASATTSTSTIASSSTSAISSGSSSSSTITSSSITRTKLSSSRVSISTSTGILSPSTLTSATISSTSNTASPVSSSIRGLGSDASPQTSPPLRNSTMSSTITPISQEFPLVTNTTMLATTLKTSKIASPVTDTFSASSLTTPASINPTGSLISTVVTIVMPTNSPFPLLNSITRTTISSAATASQSPGTVSSVNAVSVTNIPTVITSTPSATSISSETFSQNLAMAKGYNALFSSLTPSSSCTTGSIVCINGATGNCDTNGLYKLKTCVQGDSCFAIPMNNTEGVYVGCFDTITAENILGVANVNSASVTSSTSTSLSPVTTPKTTPNTTPQTLKPSTTTQAPQTFNSLSVTIPTNSVGVIVPETTQAAASFVSVSSPAPPTQDVTSTTTVRVHQTSTLMIYLTPTTSPAPAATSQSPAAAQTTLGAGLANVTVKASAGSLNTIVPMNPSQVGKITVTVTATVTATETVRG